MTPETSGIAAVRRLDRAQNDAWIRAFLQQADFGFLAMQGVEGYPHLNSNLFVYDREKHAIYMHTARTGRTPLAVRDETPVTFSAAVMGRMLPALEALAFSVEYAAVVVFGRAVSVTNNDEKRHALDQLMAKYAPQLQPGRDYRAITPSELDRTAVHRIAVDAWSGKQKVAPADFVGGYTLTPLVPPIELADQEET